MTDKKKFFINDLRNIPATAYRLPSDGRKWLYAAGQRQRLAMFLATYADADGSHCRPSRLTMAAHLSCSVRTIQSLLGDLEKLNFQRRVGIHGESGPAIRQLDVASLIAGVQHTGEQECKIREQECNIRRPEVQGTRAGVQHMHCTQPPVLDLPSKPPTTTTGGGKSLSEKHPRIAFGKSTELDALISEHGFSTVSTALAECDEESFEGVNNPIAAVFGHRLPKKLAEAKAARAVADQKAKEETAVQASIVRQIAENQKAWRDGPPRNEESIEDFFKPS